MDLSIIVPVYNEQDNVRELHRRITSVMDSQRLDYEIILVDDGSSDSTFDIASDIARADSRTVIIKFRTNYGQTPAMAAGIEHARGEILVTMDGDLQNDPADIPALLSELQNGFDLVVGWRHNRQDKLVSRKVPSRIANWLIGKVTGVPIKDNGCSLKAYRASVFRHIPLYAEMHRFIPAVSSIAGTRIAEIKVSHHPRIHGTSKYGLSRVYKVLLDLVTIRTLLSSLSNPLLYFARIAMIPLLLGTILLVIGTAPLATSVPMNVPVTGSGVLLIILATSLAFCGVLSDLLVSTGDHTTRDLAALTVTTLEPRSDQHSQR